MAINKTVKSRKAVYSFLYENRIKNPKTYYAREDLHPLSEAGQLDAAISFGVEMGHLERYRQKYYRLTATGMLFVEKNAWIEEDDYGN